MYEKTIAGAQRIYQINTTATPSTVYSLMTSADKLDYDSILNSGLVIQPISSLPSKNEDIRYRVPVDGYIKSISGSFKVSCTENGTSETISEGFEYSCPVYFWTHNTYVFSSPSVPIVVRIFFS